MLGHTNNNIEKIAHYLKIQLQILATGLQKGLGDVLLADRYPHLANPAPELSEIRRRQTELIQALQKKASELKEDLEKILFEYQRAIYQQWEEVMAAVENDEQQIQARITVYHSLLTEQQKLEQLIKEIQHQIILLENQLQQTQQAIHTTITNIFNDLILSVGDQRFTLPEYNIDIRLADNLAQIRDSLLREHAAGNMTAENFMELLSNSVHHNCRDSFENVGLTIDKKAEAANALQQRIESILDINSSGESVIPLLSLEEQLQSQIKFYNNIAQKLQSAQSTHTANDPIIPTPSAPPLENSHRSKIINSPILFQSKTNEKHLVDQEDTKNAKSDDPPIPNKPSL